MDAWRNDLRCLVAYIRWEDLAHIYPCGWLEAAGVSIGVSDDWALVPSLVNWPYMSLFVWVSCLWPAWINVEEIGRKSVIQGRSARPWYPGCLTYPCHPQSSIWKLLDLWYRFDHLSLLYFGTIVVESRLLSETSGWRLSWRHGFRILWWISLSQTLLDVLSHWLLWYI